MIRSSPPNPELILKASPACAGGSCTPKRAGVRAGELVRAALSGPVGRWLPDTANRRWSARWYRAHVERVIVEELRAPLVLRARWLGRIAYRDAWSLQQALAAARADRTVDEDQLLLLEHSAVLTLGRNARESHVMASPELLAARGIEVVRVERGGEVT